MSRSNVPEHRARSARARATSARVALALVLAAGALHAAPAHADPAASPAEVTRLSCRVLARSLARGRVPREIRAVATGARETRTWAVDEHGRARVFEASAFALRGASCFLRVDADGAFHFAALTYDRGPEASVHIAYASGRGGAVVSRSALRFDTDPLERLLLREDTARDVRVYFTGSEATVVLPSRAEVVFPRPCVSVDFIGDGGVGCARWDGALDYLSLATGRITVLGAPMPSVRRDRVDDWRDSRDAELRYLLMPFMAPRVVGDVIEHYAPSYDQASGDGVHVFRVPLPAP